MFDNIDALLKEAEYVQKAMAKLAMAEQKLTWKNNLVPMSYFISIMIVTMYYFYYLFVVNQKIIDTWLLFCIIHII